MTGSRAALDRAERGRGAVVSEVAETEQRTPVLQLLTLAAIVFLTALDQTVVVTALLPMSQSLGLTPQDLPSLSWVISGYLLGYVIVMPLMGRIADLWGHRRLLVICLAVFAGGSLLCAEAPRLAQLWDFKGLHLIGIEVKYPALAWLIVARFIQAVGGGAVVPIALAASGLLFGVRRRSVALGFISGVTEAGGALGPLYGAIILEKWTITMGWYPAPWMWLFILNLPLVALLLGLLWASWPAEADAKLEASQAAASSERSIDWIGAVVLGGALLCLSLGLSQQAGAMVELPTEHQAAHDPYLLAGAAALFIAFIALQARQRVPLIPLDLFRSMTFNASSLLSLLLGVVLIVALVNVPLFAYAVLGKSHLGAGLMLLRLTVMIPLGAFIGGWLVARIGSRWVAAGGMLVIVAGFVIMSRWTPGVEGMLLTAGTVVAGLGLGLVLPPISTTALQATVAARFGIAAAVSTSLRMVGMILGLAALTSWEINRFQQLFAKARAVPPGTVCSIECQMERLKAAVQTASAQAMAETFMVAAVVGALALLPSLLLRQPKIETEVG